MITIFNTNFPPQNTPIIDQKGTITTAWMAFFRALFNRTGQGTGLVNSVATGASGALTNDWNVIGAASILPALTEGQMVMVQNNSGGGLIIDPPDGATIDGSSSYTLPDTKMQIFWFLSSSQIISTQLG